MTLRGRVGGAIIIGLWFGVPIFAASPMRFVPPPWKTPLAFAACVAAAAFLAWLAWWAHTRSVKREIRYIQELRAEVRRRTRELERASFSDSLTGLGNRRALIEAMPQIIAQARGNRLALMVIDLDNLKPINDQFGHEAGDRVLAGVSRVLQNCVMESDRVVRWGGDEFVLVKIGVDLDGAATLAERIRAQLDGLRVQLPSGETARTTCSIGFAMHPFTRAEAAHGWEQTLNLADIALYRAKVQRNAWWGWRGKAAAAAARDLAAMLATERSSVEGNYVESRQSDNLKGVPRLNEAV